MPKKKLLMMLYGEQLQTKGRRQRLGAMYDFILLFGTLYSSGSRKSSQNSIKPTIDLQYFLKANLVTISRTSYHWIDYQHTHWVTMLSTDTEALSIDRIAYPRICSIKVWKTYHMTNIVSNLHNSHKTCDYPLSTGAGNCNDHK